MTKCLIALGSNLGDRAATLEAAIKALAAAPDVELLARSSWQLTFAVGGSGAQPEFLNGVVLAETSRDAADLLALLQQIENQHGRERQERWGSRTLDLDLLLHGDAVIDTSAVSVPHPRMSFRRFVLEPAVEIAGDMVHPTIGWALERLLDHLDADSDCVALISPDATARCRLVECLSERFGLTECSPAVDDASLWPTASTSWLAVPDGRMSRENPKLTVLLGGAAASEMGRGPTLRIRSPGRGDVEREALAAIEAVWPRLGPAGDKRLQ